MRRVKERLPQAKLTELSKLGHFLQEADPDKVAELVAEFFGVTLYDYFRAFIG
jgi:pimeloyl-ACP methyl ester carboxylesterase